MPKPIKRSRIKPGRGAFKASDNGKRTRCRTDAQVEAWALQKRAEKLAALSPGQLAIGAALREYGIRHEYEWIWNNGDSPLFSDLYLPDHKQTIEVDDESHRYQVRADMQRAMFLARTYSVGSIRYSEHQAVSGYAGRDLKQRLGLN